MGFIKFSAVRERLSSDTEFAQAIIRVPIGWSTMLFGILTGAADPIGNEGHLEGHIDIYAAAYALFSVILIWRVWAKPGNFWHRRGAGILADLAGLWALLNLGGQAILPVFLGLLWVIVGNGMRYGLYYLLVVMSGGVAIVIYLEKFNPYWNANPVMATTLAGTLIVGPLYALALLRELRRANAAVRLANVEKSKLLALASHDLRHPIHALRLFTTQLSQTPLSSQQRDIVSRMTLSTANANQMLQQFLDRSIIETGILQVCPVQFLLADLIKELVLENEVWLGAAGIRVRVATQSTILFSDRAVLRTILSGIISNAVKYAPSGRLLFGARRQGTDIYFCVYDEGNSARPVAGRNQASVDQLPPSSGVGLDLARNLAGQAGYDLSFTSTPHGSRVRLGPFDMKQVNSTSVDGATLFKTPLANIVVSMEIENIALHSRIKTLMTGWGCQVIVTTSRAQSGRKQAVAHISDRPPQHTPDFLYVLLSDDKNHPAMSYRNCVVIPRKGFSRVRSLLLAHVLEASA